MSKKIYLQGRFDFGVSFPKEVASEIDSIRGDTPRSIWLRRLAVRELERIKNKNNNEAEGRSGVQPARPTADQYITTTTNNAVPGIGECDTNA